MWVNSRTALLVHQILQLKHRQQHADHDGSNDGRHDEQQQRLGRRDENAKLPIEISLERGRDTNQFLVESARLLSDGDGFSDGRRKKLWTAAQAFGKRLAALNFFNRVRDGVGQGLVADRFAGLDFRSILDGGLSWALVHHPEWTLDGVTSIAWLHESRIDQPDLDDPIGGDLEEYRACARAIRQHLDRHVTEWTGKT